MHSIHCLNSKLGAFLLFFTLGVYSIHALSAYYDLLISKYYVEYKGTIINHWVKNEVGSGDVYYIKLSPKDKTLSEYTTSVNSDTYQNCKVGSRVTLEDKICKKDCIKGYKVTEEETKLNNCCWNYLLLSILGFFCSITALYFTLSND